MRKYATFKSYTAAGVVRVSEGGGPVGGIRSSDRIASGNCLSFPSLKSSLVRL